MEPLVVIAFSLLALAVVGSALPVLPSGALSVAGVLLYWWVTGRPGPLLLAALIVTGLVALIVDWLAGAIGASAGGASRSTTVVAALVGVVLLFLSGPLGLLLGVAATVFALEFYRGSSREEGLRAAGYALLGMLGSAVVQGVLTASILIAMVVVAL